jgi:hypothetical protein
MSKNCLHDWFWGLILIIIGATILLNQYFYINAPIWAFAFLIAGICLIFPNLFKSGNFKFSSIFDVFKWEYVGGVVLILIGASSLTDRYLNINIPFIPIFLIFLGVCIIRHKS